MSRSRSASRSPRLAPSWLRQDDLDLQACFAEEPPAREALDEAAGAPWRGYPRIPAAGDSSGFLRWCLLAREQPPGLARRWKWTSAERDAALAGMMSLCCEPPASAASSGSAQRAAEAEGEAGDAAQAGAAAEAAAEETPAPNSDPSGSEEEFESARDETDGVRDEEQKRWPNVVAQMRRFWTEAGAEAAFHRNEWDRQKTTEDAARKLQCRKDGNFKMRAPRSPSEAAERDNFLREELACHLAANKERALWRRREQKLYADVALLLARGGAQSLGASAIGA